MPVKAVVASLDGLADPIKALYTQVSDEQSSLKGKYILGVEASDGYELDNVQGLKSALGTERGEHDKAKNLLKSFEGIDPSKVRSQLKEWEELKAIDPSKEADKLADKKFASAREQLIAKHTEEQAALKARADSLMNVVREAKITASATAAIAKLKGTPELLLPIIERSTRLDEVDGKFIVRVVDGNGNPRIKDSAGNQMSIDDLAVELQTSPIYGVAFAGSGKGGTGSEQGRNVPGGKTSMTRAEFDALTPAKAREVALSGTVTFTD